MELHWHLGKTDFFAGNPEEKSAFLGKALRRVLKKNDMIFFEEDPGDSCYYLETGLIKIFRISPMGKEPIFFLRRAGELFGLAEVMEGKIRKANAQALAPCVLYEIGKEDFEDLLDARPMLARKVIQVLGRRLRYLGEQVESLMVCDVRTRLVKLLVYLCYDLLPDAESWKHPVTLPMTLTQEQMAAMTGSCQQTVSGILKGLQDEGLIEVRGKIISVRNPLALLSVAEQ